jgi:hypothetical protein
MAKDEIATLEQEWEASSSVEERAKIRNHISRIKIALEKLP